MKRLSAVVNTEYILSKYQVITNFPDNCFLVFPMAFLVVTYAIKPECFHVYAIIKVCCYEIPFHTFDRAAETKCVSWNGRKQSFSKPVPVVRDNGGPQSVQQRTAIGKSSLRSKQWQRTTEASSVTNTINNERKEQHSTS